MKNSKTTKEPRKQEKKVQKAEIPKDFQKQYDVFIVLSLLSS